jgi:hypothetical protein
MEKVPCSLARNGVQRGRIRRMLEKDKRMSFEQIAEALNDKGVQPQPGTNTWSAATARKAYVS